MTRTIYLRSYDLYEEILAYTLPQHTHRILTRKAFEQLDRSLALGYYCTLILIPFDVMPAAFSVIVRSPEPFSDAGSTTLI